MTLLTIINDVQKRLGIVVSATVMNDSSPAVKQLVAMAQVEGKDLAQRHPWSALQTRKAWTAVATEDQGALSTVASDMSIKHIRYMTAWNSTTKQQINGPLTGSQWAELKGRGMTPTWPAWRIYGSHFYIIPAPTVADAVQFEYVSKNCASRPVVRDRRHGRRIRIPAFWMRTSCSLASSGDTGLTSGSTTPRHTPIMSAGLMR